MSTRATCASDISSATTDDAPGGFLYEIAEVKEPPVYEMMMKIRDAAKAWDGKKGVREIAEL